MKATATTAVHALAALAALAVAALSLSTTTSCKAPSVPAFAPPEYGSWARTTNVPLDYPVPGHMEYYRIARINPVGAATRARSEDGSRRWDFPAGTVIVKEIYPSSKPSPGERPSALTIMAKQPEDPRARGGWLWITRSLPDGKESVFAGNFCVTCHANANEAHPYGDRNKALEFRDYVFFVPGDKSAPN
ncbi:MAG: cytochrome P460 family protein [Spirochaetaceae bacterium]|nr:cytochrome P460 family protein [Spirochaetaceae bacterium]